MGLPEIAILSLPFIIELFGDYYLISKGKKDIPSWFRVIMVLFVGLVVPGNLLNNLIISTIPYAFFDPLLNVLRGKPVLYSGKTKMYDLFLAKFNPWLVLVGRVVSVVVLLVIYNIL